MAIYIPRQMTQELRTDTINAFNILVQAGKLDSDCNYAFVERRGHWGIEIWKGSRYDPEGGVVWTSCDDIIVAAGPLKTVRGHY